MASFKSLGTVSSSRSIVTMALSCISTEIKQETGRKSRFFIPLAFNAPVKASPSEYRYTVWCGKLERCGYPMVKKFEDAFSRFDRIPDGRTDRNLATVSCALS